MAKYYKFVGDKSMVTDDCCRSPKECEEEFGLYGCPGKVNGRCSFNGTALVRNKDYFVEYPKEVTVTYDAQRKMTFPFYTKETWDYSEDDGGVTIYRKYLPNHVVRVEFNSGKIVDTKIYDLPIGEEPIDIMYETIIDEDEFEEHNEWNVE